MGVISDAPEPSLNYFLGKAAMSIFFDLFRHEPSFKNLPENTYLFREGDRGEERMYVLISGKALITIGENLVEEASAGTLVGEMGLIEPNESRSASVRTVTNCQFAEVDAKRFKFLVAEAPYFAVEVMRVLAHRLRRADVCLKMPPV